MYKSHDKGYFIQLFYRQDGEDYPQALDIPHCGKKCDLDRFYDVYRDIIPDDFETECKRRGRTDVLDESDEFDEDEEDVEDDY